MANKLFLQERFIVSEVPAPSLSKTTETPTGEMREGVIEVQVHQADAEEGVDPPVVLVVSPGSTHDASILPEVSNTVSFGGDNLASQTRPAGTRKSGRNKRIPQRFQASVEFFIYLKFFYFIKYLDGLRTDICMYLI